METRQLIKALRKALGLTQGQVAERAGFPQHTYVSLTEAGKNQLSTKKARDSYAKGFGLRPADFDAYLEERASLEATVALAQGEASPPRELRLERDPVPALAVPPDASPLVTAVGEAYDKTRHTWDDGNAVIRALHGDIDAHLAVDVDLVEKARVWLDAAVALRREGTPVTAGTLLDRVTLGRAPRRGPVAPDAFQQEVTARAIGRDGAGRRFAYGPPGCPVPTSPTPWEREHLRIALAGAGEPFLRGTMAGGEVGPFDDDATGRRGAVILFPEEAEYRR